MADDNVRPEEQTPGVDRAYDFVRTSYDWAILRLNAVESRIQALMVFSAGFIVTGPALVAIGEEDVSLSSAWFYLALATAGLNLLVGAIARAWGEIKLLGLNHVYRDWLALADWEFKQESVRWAAEHFKDNVKLVNRKGSAAIWMTFAFLAETMFLVVWGLDQLG